MALSLITGHAGVEHITSADAGSFNIAMFGGGQFVLNRGNKFSASVIDTNTVRILDGDLVIQGRHIRLKENTYEDLTFSNGTQGYKRHDLICARYQKDASTSVETCSFVVVKGTGNTKNPSDPAVNTGDITEATGALIHDFPLYRVVFNGLAMGDPVQLFEVRNAFPDTVWGSSSLANGSVDSSKLADGSVTLAKLADSVVNTAKLVDNAVSTAKLADGSVTLAKLANGSVDSSKLADGSVTLAKLANDAQFIKIASGSWTGTGVYGQTNPNTITFPFIPKLVFFAGSNIPNATQYVYGNRQFYVGQYYTDGFAYQTNNVSWNGETMSWYSNAGAYIQLNQVNDTFTWYALG